MHEQIQDMELVIDVKLLQHALIVQERLKNQLAIQNYVTQFRVIPEYKSILKAVKVLQDMKEKALSDGVVLDQDVIDMISN